MYGSACQGKNKTRRLGTKKSRGRVIWGEWTQNVKLFLTWAKALQRSCIALEFLNNPGDEMLIAVQVSHPSPLVTPALAQGGSVQHHCGSRDFAHPGDVVTMAWVLSLLIVDTKVSSSHGPFLRGQLGARCLVQADYMRLLSSQRGQQSVPNEQIHIQVMDLLSLFTILLPAFVAWKEILSKL